MYKVIAIRKGAATSFIDLLNLDTGTIDTVFDDSSVVSYDDFEFIKEGVIYDCKIELLDGFVPKKTKSSVGLEVIDSNVTVGNTGYWMVAIGKDVYYVPLSQTQGINIKDKLYYDILRKDLIQVNDVIHADCL